MTMTPETFAAMCYVVLIGNHHNGYETSAPTYVQDKLSVLSAGYDAFGHLDIHHKKRVIAWLERWAITIPERVRESLAREQEAYDELMRMQAEGEIAF